MLASKRPGLKDVRDASYEGGDSGDRIETATDTVRQLQSRTVSVAEGTLEQLASAHEITIGESHVFLDMPVLC